MIDALQDFTSSMPPLLQWLGVAAAGAVPFVESYFGSVIGVLAGINPPVAVAAAVVGNAVIGWQTVSIVLWGAAFGTLAALGVDVLSAG